MRNSHNVKFAYFASPTLGTRLNFSGEKGAGGEFQARVNAALRIYAEAHKEQRR